MTAPIKKPRGGRATWGQRRTLVAVDRLTRSMGYPPTLREISDALGAKSGTAAHDFIARLELLGLIRRIPNISRGLIITDAGQDELRYWAEEEGE